MPDLKHAVLLVIASVAFAPTVCLSAAPGAHGLLFINGEVREVRLNKDESPREVFVDLTMTLHFVNRGTVPLLLFFDRDYPRTGGIFLARFREDALLNRYVYEGGGWEGRDPEAYEEDHRKLDQKSPPAELILMIAPGASWSFDKTVSFAIEVNGSLDLTSKPWDFIKTIKPLWLQLDFMLWPFNLEQNMGKPKFGRRLQSRWKDKGRLILDNVTSEPIPLNLPPE